MASNQQPVLTKKDYFKASLRSYVLQNGFNYGNYQGTGYANILFPSLRKIYKDDEEKLKDVTISNLEFYNTNPQLVPFITSMQLAMYDSGQNEEDTRAIKFALMGPLSGIGDSLSQFGLAPLFSTIAAGMALDGLIAGPIFFIVCMFGITFGLRMLMGYLGYKLGTNVIDTLSEKMASIAKIATTIGVTVISGLSVSFVKANLALEYVTKVEGKDQVVALQTVFDKIAPNLLPVLVTAGVYVLIRKYKWSTYRLIALLIVLGIALSMLGILK
ncbi:MULTISPECIES: PTS system mannose/fructose/sorbose family transporter subunit IID [Enterococcaceae]|uniref:PTS N-acetylglucosamine transporter subunit IIBC n=2 Tax=Vagococcus TaxID=2737 RepID=A0A429ZN29_9ENTE|nr:MULTISPECIES: PTS system mannose/fructose/sorbose family transporter subunit IID [Enterococcaceae]MCI0130999.1 PTS system mannose/fructose/sorbose family transporter subunit IID [Vagococcus sp. CY53-2]OPF87604.1 PTS N-acetylglucosamine transporter subunit IIBC [Vagococcus martis]RGI29376.1 PTS system mannose/fructose/sorbose family transporter subunit IID [Melissococcus sp. OM08-11BH]RHH67809.1 PTS system mannose/fructose/sorbose family transporter subunit IID [Vagococcus sp. AM17-17]RST950